MFKAAFRLFIFVLFMVSGPLVWGSQETYGAEFELSNDFIAEVLREGPGLRGNEPAAAARLAKAIAAKCAKLKCVVKEHRGKWYGRNGSTTPEFRIVFASGFWLNISYDPGCIEVQTQPMTKEQWIKNASLIQETVFETAKTLGYEPRENRAGHFNVGVLSAFGANANVKEFLRFFVDYANHAELASGVLRKNWNTALPLAWQGEQARQNLQDLIDRVERNEIARIDQLAQLILQKVYLDHPAKERFNIEKNQAMSLVKILALPEKFDPWLQSDYPFEIRATRAQKSVYEFIQMIEIFEARLAFLRKQTGPIVLNLPDIHNMSPEQAVSRFKNYLSEAGLSLEKNRNLLPPEWAHIGSGPILCRQIF